MSLDSKDTFARVQSHIHGHVSQILEKSPRKCLKTKASGQAAVEYVLLVAVTVLIFGVMFSFIRQGLFKFWVCEIGVQVQAPRGCGLSGATTCLRSVTEAIQNTPLQAQDASVNILQACAQ
jgi:hypothetical protein